MATITVPRLKASTSNTVKFACDDSVRSMRELLQTTKDSRRTPLSYHYGRIQDLPPGTKLHLSAQDPLRLGSIIADPFRPTKPLSTPMPTADTVTHTEFERTVGRGSNKSLHGNVWAQFLQTANANIGAGVSKDVLTQYTMDSLETVYFKSDPTDEEATEYTKDGKVQAAMKAGVFGAQPVYMITGLEIAKGFRLTSEVASAREGNVGAGVPVTGEVSAGADVGFSKGKTVQESLRAGSDIIFAYQLHVIAEKGWRHRRIEVDIYAPKPAFLSKEKKEIGEKPFKAGLATATDLLELAEENEDDTVESLEAQDGDEICVCISFKESYGFSSTVQPDMLSGPN